MNADTSWRIWRSDLYSGPNTSVNHESAGTAGFKYVDWRPSQTPTRVFSISGTSPLKKPWENQLGTGPRVMRWHWQNHSTPFLRGHQERRPQQGGGEKEYAREYAGRIRRAKREREAQKRKNEKKIFATVLNSQNPSVNKPGSSLWREELILRHVDHASTLWSLWNTLLI